jgi:DNA-binding NtrC family response regulator
MDRYSKILVVDDDLAMREMLTSMFNEEGYEAQSAASADEAIERSKDEEFDAVLSDIKMPGRSGIELVAALRELRPDTPVVLMTAFGSINSAVESMRAGALDYVTKPFEPEVVLVAMERALERRALERENRQLRRALDHTSQLGDLIGTSPAMREIFALIRRVAHNRSSVLISGGSGTGKEVVARTIHFHGSRADKPFVPINCTAIPEGLLESELFGHVRGAFTGAHTTKRGLFEQANGGTIFLDEIGDMPPGLQSKLLRVLQDREVRPVGGTHTIPVDVRIIAASNKDLRELIENGSFREDLFYRLNVIPLHIPPLSDRPEDIPPLVEAFLARHSGDSGDGAPRSVSPAAMKALCGAEWRGNGRELENLIERAVALTDRSELQVEDLPLDSSTQPATSGSIASRLRSAAVRQLTLEELQDMYIDEVMALHNGNKVHAAAALGIDRKTLYRRAERRARREAAGSEHGEPASAMQAPDAAHVH